MNSAAFDVLIKILKSYRPQIPSEMVIEIRHFEREDLKTNPRNQKSQNLDLILRRTKVKFLKNKITKN